MKHLKHILLIIPVMMLALVISQGAVFAADNEFLNDTSDITVTVDNRYTIIDGVTEGELTLNKTGGSIAKAHVVLVKANAKAKFKAITPGYYTSGSTAASRATAAAAWSDSSWSTKSLTKMAAEYESAADTAAGSVIAAINGDFGISSGNGTVPRGSLILEGNGELVHSNAKTDEFFFGYKDNGVINVVQRITSQKDDFSEAICGPMYILRNGSLFGVDNENDSRSRTGVAYKTNGDVLLITVDEGGGSNGTGISVKQLANLMKASGCWNGINLDGGGSTTMLTKRSGEALSRKTFEIADSYSDKDPDTGERKISNGLLLVADNSAVANNVNATSSVSTDKDTYRAGDAIKVTASTDVDGSWAALQKLGSDGSYNVNSMSYFWYYVYGDNDAGTWCWENGATYDICEDGECNSVDGVTSSAGLSPGRYRVAVCNYANLTNPVSGEYQCYAYKDITIEENPDAPKTYSIKTDKDQYEVGEPIMVTATAPASDGKAWVGVVEQGGTLGSSHASYYWYYNSSTNAGINHTNGTTYNLYQQEQIGDTDYNKLPANLKALIDRTNRTLMPGTFKISVYANDGYTIATGSDGQPVSKTITVVDSNAEYSITYKDGDSVISGLTPATYTYQEIQEGPVALPASAEKEGYNFKGWYDNSSFSGTAVTSIPQGSSGDKTFYAKFEKKKFEVSFDTDGGTPAVDSQMVDYGDYATIPTVELTKSGDGFNYKFAGWVTERGGSTPFNFQEPVTGPVTVYAKWDEPSDYTVVFDSEGGSSILSQNITEGGKAVKPEDPTKTGYSFDKWVWDNGGTTEEFDFDTVFNAANIGAVDSITLHAVWTPIEYSITYKEGDQTLSGLSPVKYTIETETFNLPSAEKDGYTFEGWYESSDFTGSAVTSITKGSTGNKTYFAKWKKESSMTTDKLEYTDSDNIMVKAYCENPDSWVGLYKAGETPGTETPSFYYYYVKQSVGYPDYPYAENGAEFNIYEGYNNGRTDFGPGAYQLILFGDGGYSQPLKTVDITITTDPHPAEGTISLSGWSRSDKKYSGEVSGHSSETMYEYFYGDAIDVSITRTSGSASAWDNVWLGIVSDSDFNGGNLGTCVNDKWVYLSNIPDGTDTVNLNYTLNGELITEGIPGQMNTGVRWAVLAKGNKIIDAVPYHYRTYNMDWFKADWEEQSRQLAKENILVDLEWTSHVADGTDLKPALTLKRANGHFGFDEKGNEITEETLVQGTDYTVKYPSASKEPGTYKIEVSFPSSQPSEDYYRYLSVYPNDYGFRDGISYTVKDSEDEYLITYELNGGTNNAANPDMYRKGEEVVLQAPSKSGYVFEGWYTTSDFRDDTLIEKITADSEADITVYAKWADEHTAAYKITYVLNGGTNDAKNPDGYTGNVDVTLKPAKRARYTFDGWFFDSEFTKPADVIPKGTTGDLTVYAKFSKVESSTFVISTDVIGGSISDDKKVNKGASYTVAYEANRGYILKSITVDGAEVDIKAYPTSYTFENVSADHSISVIFAKEETKPADSDPKDPKDPKDTKDASDTKDANEAKETKDDSIIAVGTVVTYGSQTYMVTGSASADTVGSVTFIKARNKKSVTVPATVMINGRTYNVTRVAAKAFAKSKIRTVTIGKNVKKIDKYAFKSSKATKMIVKSKLLTKAKVKGSLKGSKITAANVKVGSKKLNKQYVKKYSKIFTKKIAGKKVTVK